jgi:hypothetical protein
MSKFIKYSDFNSDSDYINEGEGKTKWRYEISDNLRKATKIQKLLIDVRQLISEMNDELMALKLQQANLDDDASNSINFLQANLRNMEMLLKNQKEGDKDVSILGHTQLLLKNMEKLKQGYLERKGL